MTKWHFIATQLSLNIILNAILDFTRFYFPFYFLKERGMEARANMASSCCTAALISMQIRNLKDRAKKWTI